MRRPSWPATGFRPHATEPASPPEDARRAVEELGLPVVVKADGLAAGKGVVIAPDLASAHAAIDAAMVGHQFGDAGRALVIEECMTGEEASFFALCDGTRGVTLASAQDHKRVNDHDQGPNTRGMGAFAPSPRVTPEVEREVLARVVEPVTRQAWRRKACHSAGSCTSG